MNKYKELDKIADRLRKKGLMFFAPENRKVMFVSYDIVGENVVFKTSFGYGLNAEKTSHSVLLTEFESYVNSNFTKPITTQQPQTTPIYNSNIYMSDTTDNNIATLRGHLFNAIKKLEGGTMKADEAKSLASLAQTIINSAKLELDYKRMINDEPNINMLND